MRGKEIDALRLVIRESIRDDLMMSHPNYPHMTQGDIDYIDMLAAEYNDEFAEGPVDSHDELAPQDETSGGQDRPLWMK